MKYKLMFLCFITLLGLSCKKDKKVKTDSLHSFNDLESLDGWVQIPTLSNEKAHSGLCSSKMDINNPYSISFRKKLSSLSSKQLKRVEINAWVLITDPSAKGIMVCCIDSIPGATPMIYLTKTIDYKSEDINKWIKVTGEFYLPKNLNPDNSLLSYLWNTSPQGVIFADDFELNLSEY